MIEQKLSLERQAFDAHMTITNGLDSAALENIRVVLTFADEDGNPVVATTDPNATGASFFMRLDSLSGIGAVDGTGQIAAKSAGDIHWLIIPAAGTGGASGQGQLYYIGATLEYRLNGEAATVEVTPDYVMVRPQPLLQLDYFLPTDVYADDPFTAATEPPVPFTLGVRIKNTGGGISAKTSILSAQPRIVDNQQGLLIDFQIIGGYVDDEPAGKSLLLDFGDIDAGTARMGRWSMVTTLSGRFVEFDAEYQHADSLGGAVTSLIDQVNAHTLVHDVKVDLAGRDNISDFLALDGDTLRVYESNHVDTLVADQSAGAQIENVSAVAAQIRFQASVGFAYARVTDPYQGARPLTQVLRSDGKILATENAWLSKIQNLDHSWSYFINIFDANTPGLYSLGFTTGTTSTLAGVVYNDSNGNGLRDTGELGIGVVPIVLRGSDENGANVSVTAYTDASGQYQFTGLVPGRYTLTAGLVSGYMDGIARAGTSGGVAAPGTISDIVLTAGSNAASYLFSKRSGAVSPSDGTQADLAVTMTAAPTLIKTGDTITLTINARNQGPDAAAATSVAVTIPEELTFASAQASVGSYNGGLWTLGALAADASASLTVHVTAGTLSGPISIRAVIASAAEDAQATNNSASVTLTPEESLISITQTLSSESRIVLFIACPEAVTEDERTACVESKTQFADEYLTTQGYRHQIVTQTTAFKRALREGQFNVYWLSGAGALLTESLANELRLAILRGEGLILDGAADISMTALETITGTQVGTTTLGQDLSITLTASGTSVPTQGSAWSLKLQGATALATFASGQTAISVYSQGLGRTWVAGFDLWTSLAQPAAEIALSTLVTEALDQMATAPTEPVVGGLYVPLASTVQNDDEAHELTMRITLSDGLHWLDADPLPLTADTVRPTWALSMQTDESQTLRLGLRAPTSSGTATIQTELNDTDQQLTVGSGLFELETVSATDLLAQAHTQIEALAPVASIDQDHYEDALAALSEAQNAYTAQDYESALTALCAAEAALAEITGGAMSAREAVSRAAQAIGLGTTASSNDPSSITVVGGTPQEASVNTVFPAVLQAQVRDAQGTPVADATVTFSLPSSGAGARFADGQTTATATTDANGIASSPALTANSVAGSYEALARVAGVTESAHFVLTNTTTTPQSLTLTVYSGNNQQTLVSTAFSAPLAVVVRNATGTPVAGVTVVFTAPSDGASARFGSASSVSVTTDANGIASSPTLTANSVAGSYEVLAQATGVVESVQFALSNTTTTPQSLTLTVYSGNNQQTLVSTAFSAPLAAVVRNATGTPVAGVTVVFTAPSDGASARFGSASSVSVTTDANGIASSPTLTANSVAGSYEVLAQATGVVESVQFALSNTATTSQLLTLTVGSGDNQQTLVTTAFSAPLAVVVRNATGTPVAGVAVTFSLPSSGAGARFAGGQTTAIAATDANGIARSPALTANSIAGSFLVSATAENAAASIEFHLSNATNIAAGQDFTGMTVTGTGQVTASITGGGPDCAFDPTATHLSSAEGLPDWLSRFLLPHGVFTYALVGCNAGSTVQITMTWPNLSGITGYLKYGPTPWSRTQPVWYAPQNLSIVGQTIRYTVQDGSWGDDDLTANGVIRDPGGPVIQRNGATAAAIPTLSEYALATLALILLLLGGGTLRRKHRPFRGAGD